MRLIMTLLVRDEEDILAAHIDFHLAHGVDFFIATDNLSVDRTAEILRRYEERGLLHYIHETEDDYSQHRWVTHMARLARREFAADWVINSDADEFWYPEHGGLKQVLAAVPASCGAVAVKRSNFLPRPTTDPYFFADAMTVRDRHSLNALGQLLPDKVCHRAYADIEVSQGNEAVYRGGRRLDTLVAPISILHFPIRSYRQFANKIMKGGAAYKRNGELTPEMGSTWRHLYELARLGELESFYQASLIGDRALEQGLSEGRLVLDTRLKEALSALKR